VLLHRLDDTGVDAGLVHSALRLGQFPAAAAVVLLGALALHGKWCNMVNFDVMRIMMYNDVW
jgi:hypothetical protein